MQVEAGRGRVPSKVTTFAFRLALICRIPEDGSESKLALAVRAVRTSVVCTWRARERPNESSVV